MPTRIFRLVKLFRRRRDAAGADSPPSDLQPGELAVGENEGVLYYGKADGSVVSLTSGTGGGAVQSVAGRTGIVTLTKIDVGLSNVDNTSDANKPVSTATQTALDGKAASSHTHDDRYYTETEINAFQSTAQTAFNNLQTAVAARLPINAPILSLGTLSGSNAIDFAADRLVQTATLDGSAITFTKGTSWPTTSVIADVVLRLVVSSPTSITWTIVNDWFAQPAAGALSTGTHIFLLRAIGSSVIEGHYIGSKTN